MKFCHQCGTALEEGVRFCPNCGIPVRGSEDPVLGKASMIPKSPAGLGKGLEYKGVGIRFAAQLIDLVVMLIFFFVIGRIVAGIFGGTSSDGFEMHGSPAFLVIILTSIFGLAYFTVLETWWGGQTLGKKLTGIQVAREDGGSIDFSAAIIRNILRVVDGFCFYLIGAILIWRSPLKQRLGDRIAHTVVVKRYVPL